MSSYVDRPPPDPERFLAALADWRSGEATPGTTMQALKRGGLDELLAENTEHASAIASAWDDWERGKTPPGPALAALDEAGLSELLERVLAAQREAFPPA